MDSVQIYMVARFGLSILIAIFNFGKTKDEKTEVIKSKYAVSIEIVSSLVALPYFGRVMLWW